LTPGADEPSAASASERINGIVASSAVSTAVKRTSTQ
jgi:hypothetical protein